MKCTLCKSAIQTTFLQKIVGTTVRKDGTRHSVCAHCQSKYPTKNKLIEAL